MSLRVLETARIQYKNPNFLAELEKNAYFYARGLQCFLFKMCVKFLLTHFAYRRMEARRAVSRYAFSRTLPRGALSASASFLKRVRKICLR